MSSASVVQKQSLADILQNRCQACNFIEKRLQATQVFSYEIYKIFKNISTLVTASGSKQC